MWNPRPVRLSPVVRGLLAGALFLVLLLVTGGTVIHALGKGQWSWAESFYMAAISASTVGYGELPGFDRVPFARLAAVFVIVLGLGAFAYLQSMFTAFLVENSLADVLRRWRMNRRIEALSDHFVIAGCGSTGLHVVEELVATRKPFVVIDREQENLDRLVAEYGDGVVLFVNGDATNDHVLEAAGTARAAGVVAALTHDPDNLYVTLSARTINPRARIVSKVVEPEAAPKMIRAGATATVSPNIIGGRRLAAELVRPTVVEFLDVMLRDRELGLRFEEVPVPPHSLAVGRSLGQVPVRQESGALLVGYRGADRVLQYKPADALLIEPGSTLVVLAQVDEVERLRAYLGRRT